MVELDHDDPRVGSAPWVARSADGVAIWTSSRDNNPRGSRAFWVAALEQRLGRRYPGVKRREVGGFVLLEMTNRGRKPYRYQVAVRVDDDELHVIEVYFPSPAHQERHGAAVTKVLQRISREGRGG
jgi:hypothetical protein